VIKRLWYINASLAFVAVVVLIAGLVQLDEYVSVSASAQQKSGLSSGNGLSGGKGSDGLTGNNDSGLMAALRLYSERWEPPFGSVMISIAPSEVAAAGAQWRIAGGKGWQPSGAIAEKVAVGSQEVEFKPVAGWDVPEKTTVNVSKKQTTKHSVTYTKTPPPEYGLLKVTIAPQEVIDLGGKWRVDAAGPWQDSGATWDKALVGSRKIELKPVSGWDQPAGLNARISKDQLATVSAAYTKTKVGSLTVTITPPGVVAAGAQWRVTGGPWNNSGATVSDLKVGASSIESKPIANSKWITPQVQPIEISMGIENQVVITYGQPKPPPPRFTLVGTIEGYNGGLAWIKKSAQENKSEAFFVGETIDNYTLTRVSDGSVVLTCEGSEFPLEISNSSPAPVVEPSKTSPPQPGRTSRPSYRPPPKKEG